MTKVKMQTTVICSCFLHFRFSYSQKIQQTFHNSNLTVSKKIYGIITFNPMSKDPKRKRVECPSSSDEELDLVFNTPEKKFKTIIVKREKPEVKIIKDPFALRYMQKNEELRIENINLRSENKDLVV
ncbi:uncharacterized protein LOC143065349 [Mytilus galloprovincialis]|uniref:uncharacterized protein LOC143065349 n=1 Tax=Mytilus galloprovincialis TaxID=29158 RepID=UPI003F7BB581